MAEHRKCLRAFGRICPWPGAELVYSYSGETLLGATLTCLTCCVWCTVLADAGAFRAAQTRISTSKIAIVTRPFQPMRVADALLQGQEEIVVLQR